MSLTPGQSLSSYEIVALVGKGGMGEVYRARDPRLDRDVAIKVLPEEVSRDRERLLRFQREAKLLASLDHPHVAAIHGFETVQADGAEPTHLLVLEYVEGQSLAERLDHGPLPVDEALEVCEQIAQGLEAAHRKSIVHRDLKPHNVLLRPDGSVKVVDFGLARETRTSSTTSSASESPTITADYTLPGVVLGTAAYMSPEQARGRSVDQGTDIWSFGCVLYECLTGKVLFGGESATESLAAILHKEPDWSLLPQNTPLAIRRLLQRCLTRDRKRRLQAIGDARVELEELRDPAHAALSAPEAALPLRTSKLLPGLVVATLLLLGTGAGWFAAKLSVPAEPVRRLAVQVPDDVPFRLNEISPVAISPDGSILVLAAGTRPSTMLYLRRIDDFELVPLRDTEGAVFPFFSPDGTWIGYCDVVEGKLEKIAVSGGAPVPLADISEPWGATWSGDGTIVYTPVGTAHLWRVDASGTSPAAPLTALDPASGEQEHAFPSALPDGRHVLFNIWSGGTYGDGKIAVASLTTGETKVLFEGGGVPHYSPTGHIVYSRRGELLAVPFDLDRLEVTGSPVTVVRDVLAEPRYELPVYALSQAGHLVYAPGGGVNLDQSLVWIEPDGTVTPITEEPAVYEDADLAPGGQQIAYSTTGRDQDVWIFDVERRTRRLLTSGDAQHISPSWSPDGSRILYSSTRGGLAALYAIDASGGDQKRVFARPDAPVWRGVWRDGQTIAAEVLHPSTQSDIWLVDIGNPDDAAPLLNSPASEAWPAFSPNGGSLAYTSNKSGPQEIYLRFLEASAREVQISTTGGTLPFWSADGSKLYYQSVDRSPRKLFVAQRDAQDTGQFGLPREILSMDDIVFWDVTGDGERFLGVQHAADPAVRSLNVILNWSAELDGQKDNSRRAP